MKDKKTFVAIMLVLGLAVIAFASAIYPDEITEDNDDIKIIVGSQAQEEDMEVAEMIRDDIMEKLSGSQMDEVEVEIMTDDEFEFLPDDNLIIIGGSCVNEVAADVLDVDFPTCGQEFSDESEVMEGRYIIQTYSMALNPDNVAILIAGYEAEDTMEAAEYLINQDTDIRPGARYLGEDDAEAEFLLLTGDSIDVDFDRY